MIMADSIPLKKASILTTSSFLRRLQGCLGLDQTDNLRLAIVQKARCMRKEMRNHFDPGIVSPTAKRRLHEIAPIDKTQRVSGRYEIVDEIDSGSNSIIYKVWDLSDKKIKALKVLSPRIHKEADIRRFVREAIALAPLNHPHIINVEDVSWNNGNPYLVMGYVEHAKTFNELVDQFHKSKITSGSLNLILHYFADLCDALEYLHERPNPIVHRDLKPQNVLVSSDRVTNTGPPRNVIKLTDFGISRISSNTMTTLTQLGTIMGTPKYAPIPDMARENHEIDGRADLYSLGIMLYEAITGDVPFKGLTGNVLMKETPHDSKTILQQEPKSSSNSSLVLLLKQHETDQPDFSNVFPGIPKEVINLTAALLEKDPNDRPQTAKEVEEKLRAIAASLLIYPSAFSG